MLGEAKVRAAAVRLRALRPDLELAVAKARFEEGLLDPAEFDVVIDGTDSIPAKFAVNDRAVASGRPLVHAGVVGFRAQVLTVLTSDRFVDKSVAQAWATLLDEGTYLCSMSSMHRILRANHAAGERRSQATHAARTVPELLATRPGQVWSWDITKLRGPQRGVYFDLYVVLDSFSHSVVGWMLAMRESASLAERLLADSIRKQGVERDQLTIHADRGSPMRSQPVALLLSDLGVTKSHSRPHCSNDNPYSEAQFKTLK